MDDRNDTLLLAALERTLNESRRLRVELLRDGTSPATTDADTRGARQSVPPSLPWPLPL